MLTQSQIDAIAEAVLQSLKADPSPENTKKMQTTEAEGLEDMTSPEVRSVPLLDHIEDREGLERMMARTTAQNRRRKLRAEVKDPDDADPSGRSCRRQGCGL